MSSEGCFASRGLCSGSETSPAISNSRGVDGGETNSAESVKHRQLVGFSGDDVMGVGLHWLQLSRRSGSTVTAPSGFRANVPSREVRRVQKCRGE